MPSEDTKVFEFNQDQKWNKSPFIIYVDFECVAEKIDWCKDNPENSSPQKVNEYIWSGFSMSIISSFRKHRT